MLKPILVEKHPKTSAYS